MKSYMCYQFQSQSETTTKGGSQYLSPLDCQIEFCYQSHQMLEAVSFQLVSQVAQLMILAVSLLD